MSGVVMSTAIEQRAWLQMHASRLRDRLDEIADAPAKTVKKRKDDAADADKLERRLSRVLRAAAALDSAVERERQRANRLLKSKKPRDRAEALLSAIDELPGDLALAVSQEALSRATKRAGGKEPT